MRTLLVFLAACGSSTPPPAPLPHPDAVAREIPSDDALARRLGLGARDEKPTEAHVLHLTERLAVLDARTAASGAYLVVLDRPEGDWRFVASVLAASAGVTRVRVVHAVSADAIDVAVDGTQAGVWHLTTDPPQPGLRQIVTAGAGDVAVEESGPFPRAVTVGERRYTGGADGYAAH